MFPTPLTTQESAMQTPQPLLQLVTAAQLAKHLPSADWVVVDCRFSLEDPQRGERDYQQAHIPGSHYAHLDRDLSSAVIAGQTGRHPLPSQTQLNQLFARLGVHPDSHVVLYDDGPGAFASRLWWLLAWQGKSRLYMLDGGLNAWRKAGLGLSQALPSTETGSFQGQPQTDWLMDAATLNQALQTERAPTLLDARALPRFRGDVEPLDAVAGHIPTAQCLPFTDNLDADGFWLSPAALQKRLAAFNPSDTVCYCGSGVTACHNLAAFALAGLALPKLYAGSWSEWITDPTRPVAQGD